MSKLICIAAALGLLGATSLTPVSAASAGNGVKATDISSQDKAEPKKAKKSKAKKSGKKKSGKKKSGKKPSKKKTDKMDKKSGIILYRTAA